MRKLLFLALISFASTSTFGQTVHTITAVGVEYSPDTVLVSLGDTIIFDVGSTHPTTEVDLATYNANGNTPLPGGFSFPNGQGFLVASAAGLMYYICDNHISQSMKGIIAVSPNTGFSEIHLGDHKVHPNPVEDELHLNLSKSENISIYNLDGKMVERFENVETTIKLAHLHPGTYILVLDDGKMLNVFVL